jgi:hypothetical protein
VLRVLSDPTRDVRKLELEVVSGVWKRLRVTFFRTTGTVLMQGPHHLSVPMDDAFRRYAGGDICEK